MKNKKQVSLETVFFLGVFVFLLVWFTRIHPLAVYDADDWNYISYARKAIPLWGNWNPSRVFPEVFMPLCSSAAVYLLMPLLKDYMLSLSVMHGLIVTLFIVLYLLCFFRMIKRLFSLSALSAMFATTLFLIAHFME